MLAGQGWGREGGEDAVSQRGLHPGQAGCCCCPHISCLHSQSPVPFPVFCSYLIPSDSEAH